VNVGNQPWVLSRHERALGIRSDLVVNYNTWLGYQVDRCLSTFGQRNRRTVARRAAFALTAPFRYDVLHYYFGRSFLCWDDYSEPNRLWFGDLRLARAMRRKVFMTLQGCDVRLSDRSAERNRYTPCHEGRCQAVQVCRASLDARRRELIDRVLPHVDRVFVLNPELAHYVPGATFLPYASVDVASLPARPPRVSGPIRILHAPSDGAIKGTALIAAAVEKLKERHPIEFILVQGKTHAEAMRLYEEADLVIDQLLAGWYGGLAVEVMAMGKPVACYIRDEDLDFVPEEMRLALPLVRLHPEHVERDIEAAIRRRSEWPEWGRRARAYVMRWHDPARIAASMVAAYQDPQSRFVLR
jgi:hypothetical protein